MHLSCAQQIVSINNNCARTCRPLRNGAGQVQGVAKDDPRASTGRRGSRRGEAQKVEVAAHLKQFITADDLRI